MGTRVASRTRKKQTAAPDETETRGPEEAVKARTKTKALRDERRSGSW